MIELSDVEITRIPDSDGDGYRSGESGYRVRIIEPEEEPMIELSEDEVMTHGTGDGNGTGDGDGVGDGDYHGNGRGHGTGGTYGFSWGNGCGTGDGYSYGHGNGCGGSRDVDFWRFRTVKRRNQ